MGRPVLPFRQFVLKVHSRCDLACDHCYVYESADQSWRQQPKGMSGETLAWTAQRIAEHAKTHQLTAVQVVLHGGEPLLAGPGRLRLAATTLQSALAGICQLDLRIHTNGVLLNDEFCTVFADCGIKVGISLDGDRAANDRHRRYADGRSSYDRVIAAVNLLRSPRYRDLYAGLLCTIDVANDPIAVYEALLALDPPRIDFLLPHATWDHPPARPDGSPTAYADWLIAIFNRWLADGRPTGVRTFDSIIATGHGRRSLTEALGLGPSDLIVVESDGQYEQVDSLKAAFEGAPVTGFDVTAHSLDTVAQHPGIVARQQGQEGLCQTCQDCPVVSSCGGGLYTHRYRTSNGFANPSVYCTDLLKLVTHVHSETQRAGRPTHSLPAGEFRTLAAGYGGMREISSLGRAQRSLRRGLLSAVYSAAVNATPASTGGAFEAAWRLLTLVDETHPSAFASVAGHPYVGEWAVACLRNRARGENGNRHARGSAPDLAYLPAIAAAAAIRAGIRASIVVPCSEGYLTLPTLGRLVIGGDAATIEATPELVTIGASELPRDQLLSGAARTADLPPGWQPVRRLTAPGFSVALDDIDPHRDCFQRSVTDRLSDAECSAWQQAFQEAWEVIQRDHAAYAPGLAAGLNTITPLSAPPAGRDVSATARNAFGAVSAALPADHVTLALLLVHEFQHVKMGAILDLYRLYDAADRRLYHAPWRQDPRPLEGLLQGTYAHIGVCDFWRARVRAGDGARAEAQFAHWQSQTSDAVETLASSGSLTALGEQFVGQMRDSITSMR